MNMSPQEFALLTEYIQKQYGITVREDSRSTLAGKMRPLLIEMNLQSFT